MKNLQEHLNESLNEAAKIKALKEVKFGDMSVDNDVIEPLGAI